MICWLFMSGCSAWWALWGMLFGPLPLSSSRRGSLALALVPGWLVHSVHVSLDVLEIGQLDVYLLCETLAFESVALV